MKSVASYSDAKPEIIPYIDELINSVDFALATDQSAGNQLKHNMALNKQLPNWIAETKQKYR